MRDRISAAQRSGEVKSPMDTFSIEADAASKLAISLINGKDPASLGFTLQPFADPQKPDHKIQAQLLPAEVITQANVKRVVDSGALTKEEVCKGIEDACSKVGLG